MWGLYTLIRVFQALAATRRYNSFLSHNFIQVYKWEIIGDVWDDVLGQTFVGTFFLDS